MMITAAMLQLIEESGQGVLVLVDGLEEAEFMRSRLTRAEAGRQLILLAGVLDSLSPDARRAMPEVDWAGWRGVASRLGKRGVPADEAAWFAAGSLVPATLSWLRVYRRAEPGLFEFKL